MRAVGVCCGLALLAGLVACGGGGAAQKEMVEFQDHPEKFKGKTLTFRLSVTSPGGSSSVRDHPGKPLDFHAYAGTGILRMKVVMPDKPDNLPNATAGTEVLVTFVCEEGKLAEGNRATKVVRP